MSFAATEPITFNYLSNLFSTWPVTYCDVFRLCDVILAFFVYFLKRVTAIQFSQIIYFKFMTFEPSRFKIFVQ